MAVVVASFAYAESIQSRKNSAFNALFSQLIANHKDIFAEKDLTTGFYTYYIDERRHVTTIGGLVDVWNGYKVHIGYDKSVRFSHAFKYVYHEVVTVLTDDTIDRRQKRHYIGIIQSLMNKDELFCYLVNLLQHFEQYPDDEDYREQLKQYGFFDDLLREHDQRYREVMSHLCTYLYADISRLVSL